MRHRREIRERVSQKLGQCRVKTHPKFWDVDFAQSLYALIIGISEYIEQNNLRGGVNDAKTFKSYLLTDLSVPEEQITTLFDSQATREAIIAAFKNLSTDQRINRDDPIVIFYAGHGAEVQPPPNRQINGRSIQCIVPHDASRPTDSASGVYPIPDFTISSLLGKLAKAKGNNITVIFDCCHAADGTRRRNAGARFIWGMDLCPLPADIDSEITNNSPISTRILVAEEEISIQAMRSHVLLAACGHMEQAYEDQLPPNYPGFFTRALLDLLRSRGADKLTYKGCIQRFPKLLTPRSQNPVCEGTNVDRIFFNAMVPGADSSFLLIETRENQHYLQAGTAQGITPGCTFSIHADLIFGPANPALGTMIATDVKPFQSLLRFSEDSATFNIPQPAYARQTGVGSEQVLDIFITERFENTARPDPRWEQLFSGKEGRIMLRLTDKSQAELVMDADNNGDTTFTLVKPEVAVTHGVQRIPYTVPATFESVQPVLSAMAHWNWHLMRTPPARPFQKAVEVEFYKLEESGENDNEQPIYKTQGENLNRSGEADIIADEEDHYGFHITNKSTRDLYAYLLYFAIPEQAITPKFTRVFGSGRVDPSLPRGASLTLGYGSGGVPPLRFRLGMNQDIDVGIFKLLLTTTPIDLDSIRQRSPFLNTRALATDEEIDAILEKEQLWDSLTMTLIERRDPTIVRPASGPETPIEAPQKVPSSSGDDEQKALLDQARFTHGVYVNLGGPASLSNEPVVDLLRPAADCVRVTETIIMEDTLATNELGAQLNHFGLLPHNSLLDLPWIRARSVPAVESQTWTTRRRGVSRAIVNVSLGDLRPTAGFVRAVQDALSQTQDWRKFGALQEVFATWGDVVPLSMEIGAALVATGVATPNCAIGNSPSHRRKARSVEDIIVQQLGVGSSFERVMGARTQGGHSLESGETYDEWIDATADPGQWGMVKVTRVAPIVDLLENGLRREVYRLYAGLLFRSPYIGMSRLFDFDGGKYGPQKIQQIVVGFSDSRIERVTVRYASGLVDGPHGRSADSTGLSRFDLSKDEYITDMFVWATDQVIASLQLVKNTGHVSPIYGATRGITQPPVLLSGNGAALVGLSGSFDSGSITQIQGIWRADVTTPKYRCMQTSFAGGSDGLFFNDMSLLGDRSTARIAQVTARSPGTNFVGGLQITYTFLVEGNQVQQETPVRGTDNGQTTTWRLEVGESITGVRGRHDGTSICQLQFSTNRDRESPAFGMAAGNFNFSFNAPKTMDGNEMVLHYIAGKSAGRLNCILFVWEELEQLDWQLEGTIQTATITDWGEYDIVA